MFITFGISVCFAFYIFGLFFRPLMAEFGWNRAEIAIAITISLCSQGLLSPIFGKITDRFGTKILTLTGALLGGFTFIMLSQINQLWQFYLLYFLIAVSYSACGPLPASAILTKWFVKKRGLALGIATTGVSFGALVVTNGGEYLISNFGWRFAYMTFGILTWVLVIPPVLLIVKDNPSEKGLLPYGEETETINVKTDSLKKILPKKQQILKPSSVVRTRKFWLMVMSITAIQAVIFAQLQHQINQISDLGFSAAIGASVLGLIGATGGVGKIVFGYWADRYGGVKIMIFNCLFQAIGLFLMMQFTTISAIYIFAVFFGFAMGGQLALQPFIIGEFFGPAIFGIMSGITNFFVLAMGAFTPFLSAVAREYYGNYQMVHIVSIILTFISIFAIAMAGGSKVRANAVATAQ